MYNMTHTKLSSAASPALLAALLSQNQRLDGSRRSVLLSNPVRLIALLEGLKNSDTKLNIKEITIEIYNLENYLLDLEKSSSVPVNPANFNPTNKTGEKNEHMHLQARLHD